MCFQLFQPEIKSKTNQQKKKKERENHYSHDYLSIVVWFFVRNMNESDIKSIREQS